VALKLKLLRSRANPKTITVYPWGGLGNQLFVVAGGLALEKDLKRTLYINYSKLEQSNSTLNRSVRYLNLPIHVKNDTFHGVRVRISRVRFANRLAELVQSIVTKSRVIHVEEVGFAGDFFGELDLGRDIRILGYFQSYRYVSSVKGVIDDAIRELELTAWSRKLIEMLRAADPIILHIRLGDYLEPKNSYFGILSTSFYLNGVKEVKKIAGEKEVWVFSDDIQLARELHSSLESSNIVRWIQPPKEVDSLENLKVMSHGRSFVIGNSTYGWWAATLSGEKSLVVAPQKWFRMKADPTDLCCDSWVRLESKWLS
jgi:hypothetical protein